MSTLFPAPPSAQAAGGDHKAASSTAGIGTALILGALWLTVFAVTTQTMIIAPMIPRIAEQLRIPPGKLGSLVTGYGVAVGIVAILMGPISDKFGRRRMLLIGTSLMTATLALHGIAAGFGSLITVRVLTGAAGGTLTGAAAAYVGDSFPSERRGWANGWIMSGMAAGQIVGIPLGTLLGARWGFRVPFVGFALVMMLAFLMIWRFVPQPDVEQMHEPLGVRESLRHYATMLRKPAVAAAAFGSLGVFLGTSLYTLYLPVWLEGERDATARQVALLFGLGGVATVIAGPQAGKLSDCIGRRGVIIAASVGVAILMLATTYLIGALWMAYLLFFLLTALTAARASPLQALMSEIVPDEERGSLMSLTMATGQIGVGAGGAIAGPAYSAFGYASNTLLGAAAVLITAWLVWRFLPETRPAPA